MSEQGTKSETQAMLAVMAGFLLVLGAVFGWTQYQGHLAQQERVSDLTESILNAS